MAYIFKCGSLYFKSLHGMDFEMQKSFEVVSSIADAALFDNDTLKRQVSKYDEISIGKFLKNAGFELVRITEEKQ